ncbi:MAG: YggS family pyridoxal phosphate-dependent enzyme [Pseudomonadales bacterium]
MSQSVEFNIAKVQQRIRDAEEKYQRSHHSVQLIAVSKTHPAALIRQAAAAGITEIGENYVQEALKKQAELVDLPLHWHFIGPIQSNKTRLIAEHFAWVHSVDRLNIAQRLSKQRPSHLPALNICLQINISDEDSKSGIRLEQLDELAEQVILLPNLCLRGLMAIPKASDSESEQRAAFALLTAAAATLQHKHSRIDTYSGLDTLSMGMSGDMEAAIAEGATMVRIGTDIFGPRKREASNEKRE